MEVDYLKKIVVTGATSMIGVALIEEAVHRKVEVYAIVRPDTERIGRIPKSEMIHIIECELAELNELEDIPNNCDVFYHFAWTHTARSVRDKPLLQLNNIKYTLDAVNLARRCGCKKFIGAGSQAEYGRVDGKIDANTKAAPQISYGVAKYAAGLLSRKQCEDYGMVHIWCRIFSVYGRYDNEGTMLDYAIKSFMKGEPAYFTVGIQKWDYLHEKDAGCIFYLLGSLIDKSMIYRIAYGNAEPLRSYVEILSKEMDTQELCNFAEPGKELPMGLEVDVEDLFSDIDYRPQITFAHGIKMVVDYYQEKRIIKI